MTEERKREEFTKYENVATNMKLSTKENVAIK